MRIFILANAISNFPVKTGLSLFFVYLTVKNALTIQKVPDFHGSFKCRILAIFRKVRYEFLTTRETVEHGKCEHFC